MKRNLKRLALALVISISCFMGTVIWFESGKEQNHNASLTPVARLNDSSNDVQRKPQKRVIWESVTKNDELFPGEAIRTAANADAKIQLLKSGTIIHLEADSLVVLEENDKGLSLDFLQGNLLVQSANDSSDVTLKTGSGEIKLKSADMSLSRDQSGQINLEVLKGQAELAQNGKTISLDKSKTAKISDSGLSVSKDRIQVLSPLAGETILLNLSHGEKFNLIFDALPESYKVTAEIGSTRSALKDTGQEANGKDGKLTIPGKAGKWFVRLNAKSNDPKLTSMASIVFPITIEPKSPPALIEPAQDSPVLKDAANSPIIFKWVNRHKYESQVIEVASDSSFKKIKVTQNFDGNTNSFSHDLPDGDYFWRVTGFLKTGSKLEGLTSKPFKFQVRSSWEISPPLLTAPTHQQTLSYSEAKRAGVTFKWQPLIGVQRFIISAHQQDGKSWKPVLEQELEATHYKLPEIRPGLYKWQVSSINPKDNTTKPSKVFTFRIEDMPKIEWAEQPSIYEYATPTPSFRTAWTPLTKSPANYKLTLHGTNNPEKRFETVAKITSAEILIADEGTYEAIITAQSTTGQTIAQSEPKIFEVKRKPLLPAPQWSQSTPQTIKSDAKGNLSFTWQEVTGASRYLMILEDNDGKVVNQKELNRTTASINKLKPGQYKVKLKSVDSYSRQSQDSTIRPVVVPSISDIRAPKIKQMKVK